MAKKLTPQKARQILHDKSVHGHPLTDKQRKFFGAVASGAPVKKETGGWLDQYQEGGAVESRQGGYTNIPFRYNSAWGGQFQDGGGINPKPEIDLRLPTYEEPKPTINPYSFYFSPQQNVHVFGLGAQAQGNITDRLNIRGGLQSASVLYPGGSKMFMNPQYNIGLGYRFEQGGSIPGSVGFTYARTKGIPSEGPYAKKTMPSAQRGKKVDAPCVGKNCRGKSWKPTILDSPGGQAGGFQAAAIPEWQSITDISGLGLDKAGRKQLEAEYKTIKDKYPGLDMSTYIAATRDANRTNVQLSQPERYGKYFDPATGELMPNVDPRSVDPFMRFYKKQFPTQTRIKPTEILDVFSKMPEGLSMYEKYANVGYTAPIQRNGGMTFYQHGLDWKPKTISENGSLIPIAQTGEFIPPAYQMPRAASESTRLGVSSLQRNPEVEREIALQQARAKQGQLSQGRASTPAEERARLAKNRTYASQNAPYVNIDEQGNLSQAFPDASMTGELRPGSAAAKTQKGLEHMLGAMEAVGAAELGALGIRGIANVARNALAQSMESGVLSNTYKLNPWRFKPNPEAYYHRSPNLENIINKETGTLQGFGQSEAGRLFDETAGPRPGMGINLKKAANSKLYFAKGTPLDWGRTNMVLDEKTGKLIPGQGYPGPYMVEVKGVPMGASTKGRAPGAEPTRIGSYAVSKRPISLDEARFYKEDWLRGYKEVSKPDVPFKSEINWGAWNSEIPSNKALMNEYMVIEKTSKANGSWMKNPDGSPFQGTPEQFVQQNSENFKKAFGNSKLVNADGSPKIIYHGTRSGNLINDEFKAPSLISNDYRITNPNTIKDHNYFASNKEQAEKYANSMLKNNPYFQPDPKTYDVYANIENPYLAGDIEVMSAGRIPNVSNYDAVTNLDLGINAKNKFAEVAIPYWNKVKSAIGNNGMFDMTNPNIYKALVPAVIGATALQKQKKGGVIKDDMGYWNPDNWGKPVEIGSNEITMQGVDQPLLGISDTGDIQMMFPGEEYKFKGKKVTEFPITQKVNKKENGGWLDGYK